MLYTKNLLGRYINVGVDIEEIARELTLKTCEVEEIHHRSLPDLVVIGKVTERTPHPDADKLSVCQVDCGPKGHYQICCGATNVDAGMYVAVALPGCHLPSINLTIEPRQLRGQDSNGMICSKAELGFPEDLEEKWIWILQKPSPPAPLPKGEGSSQLSYDFDDIEERHLGISLGEMYPWLETWTIDVENKTITHRPDMFGHFGLSNELHAIFPDKTTFSGGKRWREYMHDQSIFQILDEATVGKTPINIQSSGVRTYTLLELNNISRVKSDLYLRSLCYDIELAPKANWIDMSNIFMYLTGQPIHFFDAGKVTGTITVRDAKAGEKFTDLFDKEYTLSEQDMVICDDEKILALAGIIGSNTSGVDEHTTNILCEIANFDDVQVRKTAMRLGLRTDAEVRFEKDINPLYSLYMLPFLLDELQFFKKSLGNYDIGGIQRWVNDFSTSQVKKSIHLDTLAVERMLFGSNGEETSITDENIAKILMRLGCTISKDWFVSIPVWRGTSDIEQQVDLLEEIARMYGFHNLPELPYKDSSSFVPFTEEVKQQRLMETLLTGTFHYDQIETYPWLHQRWIDVLGFETTDYLFSMRDLDSAEQKYLRSNITASMLEILEKNAHFIPTGRVFDTGKTRLQGRDIPEHNVLGLMHWTKETQDRTKNGFMQLRSHIAALITRLGITGRIEYISTEIDLWHPKQQLEILVNKQVIGIIVTVHPSLAQVLKLPKQIQASIAQIDLTLANQFIPATKKGKQASYATLQDQWIEKDLSFVLDKDQEFGLVTSALEKVREISKVEVFDLYQGEHLPENKKSIAVRYAIHMSATKDPYTSEQLDEIMKKAIAAGEKAGASLR